MEKHFNFLTIYRLIESVNSSIFNKDTVRLMKQLLDNYDPDVSNPEVKTSTEQTEETRFLDALMETPLMQRLERFLKEKSKIIAVLSKVNKQSYQNQVK